MSSYITTSSKIHFTPVSPDPEQIVIRDIAHALSLMTRANGHFSGILFRGTALYPLL